MMPRHDKLQITVVSRNFIYAMIVLLVSIVGVGASSVLYSNHVAKNNNRQWCKLLNNLDRAYRLAPAETDTGKLIALEIHRLVIQFECTN